MRLVTCDSYILNIETSSQICSVSLSKDGKILEYHQDPRPFSHAEALFPFIQTIFQKYEPNMLSAVAISSGPGSYTGLRIGASAAKGLCFALNIPLIAVSTLLVMAQPISVKTPFFSPDKLCVCVDARRMEVFYGVLNPNLEFIQALKAEVLTPDFMTEALNQGKVYFLGNCNEKIKSIVRHQNAVFIDTQEPSAKDMATLSKQLFSEQKWTDLAYFEPEYGKGFYSTKNT